MRALEDLLNDVRDRESRHYLEEATLAYNAGAFRAAIVATWVAVAFDLIAKIRQLAAADDPAANDFTRRLDQAIEGDSISQQLAIERNLLKDAHEKFEFIELRELRELERLRDDRHVCAHPAFVRPEVAFEPSAELVRAHLATAVDAVLSKGPTPGKRAIERFMAEIERDSFLHDPDALTRYLRQQYFEPGKSTLRRGLAELIVRQCLDGDANGTSPRIIRRYAMTARALERIAPALLTDALSTVVTKREQGAGLSDGELLCFTANLGDMSAAWQALPDASHVKVYQVLKSTDVRQLVEHGIFSCALIAEARAAVDDRLHDLTDSQLADVIGQDADARRFGQAAITALHQAPTHEDASRIMETLVLPLTAAMTADQVRAALACLQDNPQARMAAGMPSLFTEFFDRARPTFAECYNDWFELAQWLADTAPHRDPANPFAYPDLWSRVMGASPPS
jgi:hypothetical protein